MNDSLVVRRFQRVRNLPRESKRLVERQRPTPESIRKSLAFHQLHDEKSRLMRLLQIMDRSNVGMIKGSERFGFTLKTAHPVRIARKLGRQNLDRDLSLQLRIPRPVHLTHSTFAE